MTRRRLLKVFVPCLVLFASAALLASGAPGCNKSAGGGGQLRIAVIPKGTTHDFWKSVEAGARKAGDDLKVEILWKGPLTEGDMGGQIAITEQFISEGVSGICLAPVDSKGLVRPVKAAGARKVPVVVYDSGLDAEVGKDFVSFVGTDNHKGGFLGGEELARLLNNKGKVVLLRYMEGSASTTQREEGFLESMSKHPDIEIISRDRYAQDTVDKAKDETGRMLDVLRQADGLFCVNESSTVGMLLTLRQAGLAGKIKFVGFDASKDELDALEKNELDGLVAQNPTKMGYLAVETMVKHLQNKPVDKNVDTGVEVVTRQNLADPRIKELLHR